MSGAQWRTALTHDRLAQVLGAGKLPPDLLEGFLGGLPSSPRVVVGAQYGEDAAVVEVGGHYLIIALDPVTLSAAPGRIAVQINANDIAVMGAEPRWLLAAVLFPTGSTAGEARGVLDDLRQSCSELGIGLIGGHTEITPVVTQPVVAACMIGEVARERLVVSSGARAGDALLLAGPIAVEGTGILCREYSEALRARGVPEDQIRSGARLLDRPGISVLAATRAILSATLPHAMHDPTEGGLLSALREMVVASDAGVRLDADAIPIIPACRAVCDALELEPLGLLASGSLLAAVSQSEVQAAREALADAGIDSADIGRILPLSAGMVMVRKGVDAPLLEIARDELARWVEQQSADR